MPGKRHPTNPRGNGPFASYEAARDEIVRLLASPPPDGRTFWPHSLLSRVSGIGFSTVRKILAEVILPNGILAEVILPKGAPLAGPGPADSNWAAWLNPIVRRAAELTAISIILASHPPKGHKLWSIDLLVKASGIHITTVKKILAVTGLSFEARPVYAGPAERRRWAELDPAARHEAGLAALTALLNSPPPYGQKFWPQKLLVKMTGLDHETVTKILAEAGLSKEAPPVSPDQADPRWAGLDPAARREAELEALSALLATPSPDGGKYWPLTLLAKVSGIERSTVERILAGACLPSEDFSIFPNPAGRHLARISLDVRQAAARTAISALLDTPPPDGYKFWTKKLLERETGITRSAVKKILAVTGLSTGAPHVDSDPADHRRCAGLDPAARSETWLAALSTHLDSPPPLGHKFWTLKLLASKIGISRDTVSKIMARAGLSTGSLRNDPGADARHRDELAEISKLLASPSPNGLGYWTQELIARETGLSTARVRSIMAGGGLSTGAPRGGFNEESRQKAELAAAFRHEAACAKIIQLLASPPPDGQPFWNKGLLSRESGVGLRRVEKIMAQYGLSKGALPGSSDPTARHEAGLTALSTLLNSPPPDGRKSWTQKLLARESGISLRTVTKIMAGAGLSTGVTPGNYDPDSSNKAEPARADRREAGLAAISELLASPPPDGHRYWTQGLLAKETGIGIWTVRKIMAGAGLSTGAPNGGPVANARHRASLAASERREAGLAAISELLASPPPDGRGYWNQKLLAQVTGIGIGTVPKIMAGAGLSTGAPRGGPVAVARHRASLAASERHEAGLAAISELLASPPPDGFGHWTQNLLAQVTGIGIGTVRRIMSGGGLSTRATWNPAGTYHMTMLAEITTLLASPPPDGQRYWTQKLLARESGISLYNVVKLMAEAGLSTGNIRGRGALTRSRALNAAAGHESKLAAISALLDTPPPDGRKTWTQALLSRESGVSLYSVKKLMAGAGLSTGNYCGHAASSPRK
ncbi:MAG: hypothetical protein LBT40_07535 [Deltaproteobacteria bacterium]|jgi:hypothetical protein|nr:hypothetical protein [Deltaproteobacteria bacterium]